MIRRFPESSDVGPLSQSLLGAFGRTDLYVVPASGDDDNPGSIEAPLATLNEAIRRVNTIAYIEAGAAVVVHLASGTYTWARQITPKVLRGQLVIIGDGAGQAGDDGFTELVGSTAAGAGTTFGDVVTSGLTVDALQGKTLEVLSGDAAGKRVTIRNNTATSIVGAGPIQLDAGAIAAGDLYRVVEPAVIINGLGVGVSLDQPGIYGCGTPGSNIQDSVDGFTSGTPSYVALVNMRLQSAGGAAFNFNISRSRVVAQGVELYQGTSSLFFNAPDGELFAGGDDASGLRLNSSLPALLGEAVSEDEAWSYWGLMLEAGESITFSSGGRLRGTIVGGADSRCTIQAYRLGLIGGALTDVELRNCRGTVQYSRGSNPVGFILRQNANDACVAARGCDVHFDSCDFQPDGTDSIGLLASASAAGATDPRPSQVGVSNSTFVGSSSPAHAIRCQNGSRVNVIGSTGSGFSAGTECAVYSNGSVVDEDDLSALTAGVSLPAAATSDGRDGFISGV